MINSLISILIIDNSSSSKLLEKIIVSIPAIFMLLSARQWDFKNRVEESSSDFNQQFNKLAFVNGFAIFTTILTVIAWKVLENTTSNLNNMFLIVSFLTLTTLLITYKIVLVKKL